MSLLCGNTKFFFSLSSPKLASWDCSGDDAGLPPDVASALQDALLEATLPGSDSLRKRFVFTQDNAAEEYSVYESTNFDTLEGAACENSSVYDGANNYDTRSSVDSTGSRYDPASHFAVGRDFSSTSYIFT